MNNLSQKTLLLGLFFITTTSYIMHSGHIYLEDPTDSFDGEDLNNANDLTAEILLPLDPDVTNFILDLSPDFPLYPKWRHMTDHEKKIRRIAIRSSYIYPEDMEHSSPWNNISDHRKQIYYKRIRAAINDCKNVLESKDK